MSLAYTVAPLCRTVGTVAVPGYVVLTQPWPVAVLPYDAVLVAAQPVPGSFVCSVGCVLSAVLSPWLAVLVV